MSCLSCAEFRAGFDDREFADDDDLARWPSVTQSSGTRERHNIHGISLVAAQR
jgi:hypothetical protein